MPNIRHPGLVRSLAVIAAAASLCACATDGAFPANPEPKGVLDARVAQYFGPRSDDDYYCPSPTRPAPCRDPKAVRDNIIENRIGIYGEELAAFQVTLKNSATGIDLGTKLMSLILNGFAATTGTSETKAALSAAAGGFTAANGVINTAVFRDQTVDAIIAQMNADFDKARLDIYHNLQQPVADYPLARAETDLTSRIRTIGVSAALTEISEKASAEQKAAQAAVQNVQWAKSANGDRLYAWLFPGGKLNAARAKGLQAWLDARPETQLHGVPLEVFAHDEVPGIDAEAVRGQALDDPMLQSIP